MIYATPVQVRRRPIVMHAMRFDGSPENAKTIVDWIESCDGTARYYEENDDRFAFLSIDLTKGGAHFASVGAWIVQSIHGEFYPVDPDIFAETYELVSQTYELWPGVST